VLFALLAILAALALRRIPGRDLMTSDEAI
jgi:hypothetical protein